MDISSPTSILTRAREECRVDRLVSFDVGFPRVEHGTDDAQELVGHIVHDESFELSLGYFPQEILFESYIISHEGNRREIEEFSESWRSLSS